MDYYRLMCFYILLFAGAFMATSLRDVCKNYTYQEHSETVIHVWGAPPPREACTWPLNTTRDSGVVIVHVIYINLKVIQRDWEIDTGTLILPGNFSVSNSDKGRRFIYTTPQLACNSKDLYAIVDQVSSRRPFVWKNLLSFRTGIKYVSTDSGENGFELRHAYVECKSEEVQPSGSQYDDFKIVLIAVIGILAIAIAVIVTICLCKSHKGRKEDHEATSQLDCQGYTSYNLTNNESDHHPTQHNEEEAAANRTFEANQTPSYEEIPAGGIRCNNVS